MKAASTVSFGVTDTVGQALCPFMLTSGEASTSNMGKKITCQRFVRVLVEDKVVDVRDADF